MALGKEEIEFKKRLEAAKITGADLIRETGINYTTYSRWVNGIGNLKESDYNRLIEALTKAESLNQI